ncbi:MAG: site-2 protease family protein, partial [Alphaproteobacteria bacterium]|nr:site-2 protease family protein [Alphaproteobacteria bacterium]
MEIIFNIIHYVIPFIILLGILVFVHEFGHFIVARISGVEVSAFSIGFGKVLWSKRDKKGTEWKISAIPLGGYCQFLGDEEASSSTSNTAKLSDEQKKRAFAFQKPYKKLAIVLAGPGFNYLFAILIYTFLFAFLGRITFPPVVGEVLE